MSDQPQPPTDSTVCPRCGSSSPQPLAGRGVCLHCAGGRVLGFAMEDFAGGDSFLTRETSATSARDLSGNAPERIGLYEIIDELGRGGMGRVYAAWQMGLGRIVALKVIPESPATAGLELRFLREVQTVAKLRHPGIVAVHDTGRANGFVYFSMDYIEGGDLSRRLRERPFEPRVAAILLQKVAAALAYAHAAGVLHRDLKPSNILLDGEEPQLADFGLAAQLETGGDLTAQSGVLGTPHYLAPEALQHGSAALTVASDIYALGVIAFEVLTGRTPFAGASPAELPSLLLNSEPPAPRLLAPAVPRDLETICLTCLERDPARRYASAAALADDLGRFLAGQPITAKPPGRIYIFQKFARRHRTAFTVAAAATVILIGATVVSAGLAVRARHSEKTAATEAATSRAISEFLQNDLLAQAAPDLQPERDLRLRTVLDRAAKKIGTRFADQPLVEASILVTLAATYDSLGEYGATQPYLERALALRLRQLGPRDPQTLSVRSSLAMSLYHQGQYRDAETAGLETWKLQQQVLGAEHPDTLGSANNLALIYQYEGKHAQAEELFAATLALSRRVLGPENPATLESMHCLAVVCRIEGKFAQAESLLRTVIEARQRTRGPEHPATFRSMCELASVLQSEGKLADAEVLHLETLAIAKKILGPEDPNTLTVMNNLALAYQSEGKLAPAEAMFEQVLEISRRVRGPEHPNTLNTMNNLALTYYTQEKFHEAETRYVEALILMKRVLGPEHPTTLGTMINLALTYQYESKPAEAEALADQTRTIAQRALGAEHPITLSAMNSLAVIYQNEGKLEEAATLHLQTLALRQRVLGAENPGTATSIYNLALTRAAQGNLADALTLHRQALDIRQRKFGPAHPSTLQSQDGVGGVLVRQGKFAEAEPVLRSAWENRQKTAPDYWRTFATESLLGEALTGLKRFADAEARLLSAHGGLEQRAEKIPTLFQSALGDTTRLTELYTQWGKSTEAQRWRERLEASPAR